MKNPNGSKSGSRPRRATDKLQAVAEFDVSIFEPDIAYEPMPDDAIDARDGSRPVWRVRFDLASDPSVCFGLDVNGEVILGRGQNEPGIYDLSAYGALQLGISRRHLLLRPSATKLFMIDLGSTNGTLRNGHSIGVNTPYSLVDRDTISLGKLHLVVRIIARPKSHSSTLREQADVGDALMQIAASITSHLELDEVLNQITEISMELTSAGEMGIWLIDEKSGELFLEAQRGIDDDRVRRMRIPVNGQSPVTKVIKSGQPMRASRTADGEQIKVKTDYLVESLVYVPLTLGGVTFGVLSGTHRQAGKQFDERNEKLLSAIGYFAAIAVQNARQYQVTDRALEARGEELAALNELSEAVSATLDLGEVYDILNRHIYNHWRTEAASLWLVGEHDQSITLFAPRERDRLAVQHLPTDLIERLARQVVGSGEPLLTNEIQMRPSSGSDARATIAVAGSAACVPLSVEHRVMGVLVLFKRGLIKLTEDDMNRLQAFANAVAPAIQNARLFARAERERATVRATAKTLSQPLLIVDESGEVLITNEAADRVLSTDMSQVFEGIRDTVGRTSYMTVGERTYITSVEHEAGVGTIAVMQDVTEFKQAEDALRDNEERYRTLVETSPDAITLTDLQGKVMVSNRQAAILYGFDHPEEAIGKDAFDFIAPEDRQRARDNLQKVLETGGIRNVEYTMLKKDGARFPAELNASLLKDNQNRPVALIGVVRDITHIKQLEQARADFIHALSHDLKGPLSSIQGWAQLLQRTRAVNTQGSEYVNRINASADRILDMIHQLLDIASLSELPHLELSPCRLDEIVTKAVNDLEGAAQVKSIKLKSDIKGNPYTISGDARRLHRGILNLIDNAIKYSPDKSSILTSLTFEDSRVTLTVHDNGSGIPADDAPHIFEKYYRGILAADGKTGAGLGLTTVQTIVKAHGGTVSARNVEGGGAEFTVILPASLKIEAGLTPLVRQS